MKQVVIENPIINSAFSQPTRHFRFDDEGITNEIVEARRTSHYFIPIAKPKKKGKQAQQLELDLGEWTSDRIEENKFINRVRDRVSLWRRGGYLGVTPITRRLLEYWTNPERERRLYFCQIEALETVIYITEVAKKYGDNWIDNELRQFNADANPLLFRMACKMATGTGKTVVMSMLIAWHTLNKIANPQNRLFSDAFLVVTPGITVRDRLRVLQPNDAETYYKKLDLVPPDLMPELDKAKIVLTNYHAFGLREKTSAGKLTKDILTQGKQSPFTETPDEMVRRVCKALGNKKNIIVINDEAHHCYRRRVGDDDAKLKGDDRKEAEKRNDEARRWISGIEAVANKIGVKVVYDLSATPFFLKGSGYPEGNLFPWVVSDFSLIDAIEDRPVLAPGALKLFSNVENGNWTARPNTILVDSEQLESGEAMSAEFKKIAAQEIEEFKAEYRERYPGQDPEKISAEELLREVLNTVGKPGKLGEHVRCVISVSMLTEGWDANTVTHILGVRAFGTQLLCEQVVGRGLRRISYAVNEQGMYEPEYAEVYGVPFAFIPCAGSNKTPKRGSLPTRVRALEERIALEITFPRVIGYRYNITEEKLKPKPCKPFGNKSWRTNPDGIDKLIKANRLFILGSSPYLKQYYDDFSLNQIDNSWSDQPAALARTYVVQTAEKFIQRCLLMTTDPGDLVLDPTCGSGTTAFVAEQWGRRWITIDTSRVALALARTRLMSAKYPYYLLADSPEGIQKEAEITGQLASTQLQTENDIRKGFVYRRVPHITLKAIANNPEIGTIHAKWQQQLEPIRIQINQLVKKSWEEWEIPCQPQEKWSQQAKDLLQEWWERQQQRQREIDESIARRADTEILYDQPYENNKRLRVTGPFTVESLSPHRVLSTDEERPASEAEGQQQASDQFEIRIIENLKKAGVQNTIKNERLKFDFLEPHAGIWLHATGEYTEADGTVKLVAVSIGSEYGTVGSDQIKEAAKEAVRGLGCDLLIICGFAFDPGVSEESKRFGKLTVLPTKMNPDLLLGDELLKKTSAANLFMVFGEPDIEFKRQDSQIVVTLQGLDIYDPTTGEIRSSSPDEIACWFIDTNYNGESFFVRHAYFTGADQPYDKLKRVLRAEIDESAWSALYSTTSRPFDPPQGKDGKPGKIAIKVINHYGDEVLKVYEVV